MVNFPEVSMWGRSPWGGWGANPLPTRFEVLWKQTEGKVFGGMPYVRLRGFFPLFLEPGYFRFGSPPLFCSRRDASHVLGDGIHHVVLIGAPSGPV